MTNLSANLSDEAVIKRFIDFCVGVGTPLAHQAIVAVKHNPAELKKLLPEPGRYSSAESFALDWQVYSFLKKFKGLPGQTDKGRREAALTSWSAGEDRCFHANRRIDAVFRGDTTLLDIPLPGSPGNNVVTLATIISMAQRKVESVLGPFNFKKVTHECRWSTGATADLPRGTQMSKKMTESMTVTKRALPHLRKVISRDPMWMSAITGRETYNFASPLDSNFSVIDYNRFLTVPKTAFTDRCIGAEPTGNAFLQQGVGRYIRGRLKRFGVDLDDQSWNQWLASRAYSLGYSTLDLEGASDSVSLNLVRLLLPARWFDYLSDLRTPFSRFANGKTSKRVHLQKFSSMGNAFTFELESLLFWSLASSINEAFSEYGGSVGVYGDDIVVKRDVFDPLVAVLNWCGFKVNSSKSYRDGNFFESCGANYFMGVEVTGFNQEESLTSLAEIISFHNRAVRWSIRIFGTPFAPVCKKLVSGLSDGRHLVPMSEESDSGFLVTARELQKLKYDPNHGYLCQVVQFVPSRETLYKQVAFYAYKLRRKQYQNPDPKGQPVGTAIDAGTWISTHRWIHRRG
jgi:hypothetical protein